MYHILLCGDSNSRAGQAPDYESGVTVSMQMFQVNVLMKI